jgi:hypothetical protein
MLKKSKKQLIFDKKNLESLKIEVIKNFYCLADLLIEHGFDSSKRVYNTLSSLAENYVYKYSNYNEDLNLLTIVKYNINNNYYSLNRELFIYKLKRSS